MKTYDACIRDALCNMKIVALGKMQESMENWDIDKHPEIPKEYIKASNVFYALIDIEKTAFENFISQ